MAYVGIQAQKRRNNFKSMFLLLMFPAILVAVSALAVFILFSGSEYDPFYIFLSALPYILGTVGIWFLIAYFANVSMIRHATGARPLSRSENPRIYNIVENLCISCGMKMPKVNVIDSPELNAFASGINDRTYTVTVTTGILDRLDDEELAGVVGHELTHIRNNDTKLLIVSIVFVGIMSMIAQLAFRIAYEMGYYSRGSRNRSSNNSKDSGPAMILVFFVVAICATIAWFFSLLTRFAISRKREFQADAGGAELCRNPLALASALRKISQNPGLEENEREDIAQLYIFRSKKKKNALQRFTSSLFSTHPDIETRIKYLEQF